MEYGILGGSDLDQSGKFLAKLMTKLMMPVFYPFIANGEMKIPFMKKKWTRCWRRTMAISERLWI